MHVVETILLNKINLESYRVIPVVGRVVTKFDNSGYAHFRYPVKYLLLFTSSKCEI
jgi:hypothetical protein